MKTADFPRLLAAFFTDRLMQQLQASPHTIASYRDTFRLLVRHARKMLKKDPTELELGDLDTDFLGAFLSHLEDQRGNDARTRNTRLAAIRSFFGYVASHEPQHAALAQRVRAMPNKRHTRRPVDFLNRDEVEALLRAPDLRTRAGRRDRTLLLVAVQTGLRASELFGLRCRGVQLGPGAHLRCHGKGRKERCTPLAKSRSNPSAVSRSKPSPRRAMRYSSTRRWKLGGVIGAPPAREARPHATAVGRAWRRSSWCRGCDGRARQRPP